MGLDIFEQELNQINSGMYTNHEIANDWVGVDKDKTSKDGRLVWYPRIDD